MTAPRRERSIWMPYSSNSELPSSVRDALPAAAQTVFRRVVNAALDSGEKESSAFAVAWTAVRDGWKKKGDRWVAKSTKETLYVHRKLDNAQELIDWAKANGFETTLPADDMHCTILYSKTAVDWDVMGDHFDSLQFEGGDRSLERFDKGAVVLRFRADELEQRHKDMLSKGATSDYPDFKPHVTLSYKAEDLDLSKIKPFAGTLKFGPEVFRVIDDGWKDKLVEKSAPVVKSADKRLDTGWASVIEIEGKPVVDTQGDVILVDDLVLAAHDFMSEARNAKVMHLGSVIGEVVESLVFTKELQSALGIDLGMIGWLITMKVHDDAAWELVKEGTLKMFSIGGKGVRVNV